jgi:hypothetical protein
MITKTALIKLFPPMSRIDTIAYFHKGMHMNKTLLVLFAGALIVLAGCGGGGGGGSSDNNNSNNNSSMTSGTKLSLYTDKVSACTPSINGGNSAGATNNLDTWTAWAPGLSGTVLGKLFDQANGRDECVFNRVQVLDSHIELVNQFSDRWETPGTYTQGNITATVQTSVATVIVPFLNPEFALEIDRLVTLNVPDQNLTIHMAFSQSNGNQSIVEQYSIGTTESGSYLARIIGNDVQIWTAGIVSGSKVQIMWEGNTGEKWFKISETTNASGGNWEVMGGGSIASPSSGMSLMARNNQNNNSSDPDTYYITTTLSSLENGTLQPILNALAQPPNPNTDSEAYITEGNDNCLGFLGRDQYPNSLDDLAWVQ